MFWKFISRRNCSVHTFVSVEQMHTMCVLCREWLPCHIIQANSELSPQPLRSLHIKTWGMYRIYSIQTSFMSTHTNIHTLSTQEYLKLPHPVAPLTCFPPSHHLSSLHLNPALRSSATPFTLHSAACSRWLSSLPCQVSLWRCVWGEEGWEIGSQSLPKSLTVRQRHRSGINETLSILCQQSTKSALNWREDILGHALPKVVSLTLQRRLLWFSESPQM